jgi:hypothetical protein
MIDAQHASSCLCALTLLLGCLSTPEPKGAVGGHAHSTPWSTTFERVNWTSEWTPKDKGTFGIENTSVEDDPQSPGGRYLRVQYWQGSASPSASRRVGAQVGGAQLLGQLPGGPADRLFLRYFVRFADDFDFVKGGKLPGFYGGHNISGGHIPDGTDGFSTRFMWRSDGQGEVYVYMPSSTRFGTSLGRGSFHFTPGKWHCLEQELTLNTPGQADGQLHVWLDSRPVFEQGALFFRSVQQLAIEGVFFSTFFGGGDSSWAPPSDTHADFAAFATAPTRLGCELPR